MNTTFISTFQTVLKRLALISTIAILAACAGNNTSSNRTVPDGYYKVRPGDTLTQIAKRYGQNVNTLVAWNNLLNASQIEVGQVLRVRRHVASRNTATQQRQATAVTPINRLSLQWPTDNASSSIIQRYNGTTSKGIDIAGTQGQQIRSAAAGTVIYVGEEVRGYGKLILISHNDYTITAYAHNDTLLVQKDQKVQAGQVIATMGSSDTDSVKLHFEVRLNGKAVDPLPYLTRTN
ncbi:peptidoglycan DD-metalloendopeptidase family protein [Neisseria subflava]|uniref:Peptidoglycan DD-metalloendopeptidase family protein n=1 Tax=Neisseria subflava TaxID=28449 RepID=A0A9X9HWM6_NEISU|nr:peptidoglycan DD-metalloendopeptidase family protein [Neisseria subflava]UTG71017.1 peptidoglycan DD-metalloendopeptidase family protein [Neisseria subflava]